MTIKKEAAARKVLVRIYKNRTPYVSLEGYSAGTMENSMVIP